MAPTLVAFGIYNPRRFLLGDYSLFSIVGVYPDCSFAWNYIFPRCGFLILLLAWGTPLTDSLPLSVVAFSTSTRIGAPSWYSGGLSASCSLTCLAVAPDNWIYLHPLCTSPRPPPWDWSTPPCIGSQWEVNMAGISGNVRPFHQHKHYTKGEKGDKPKNCSYQRPLWRQPERSQIWKYSHRQVDKNCGTKIQNLCKDVPRMINVFGAEGTTTAAPKDNV